MPKSKKRSKMCQEMRLKSANSQHYSLSQQNGEKISLRQDFLHQYCWHASTFTSLGRGSMCVLWQSFCSVYSEQCGSGSLRVLWQSFGSVYSMQCDSDSLCVVRQSFGSVLQCLLVVFSSLCLLQFRVSNFIQEKPQM